MHGEDRATPSPRAHRLLGSRHPQRAIDGLAAAKKSKSPNVRSKYDQVYHRKAQGKLWGKLCLEQPSVLLDSMVLRSSSTEPKTDKSTTGHSQGGRDSNQARQSHFDSAETINFDPAPRGGVPKIYGKSWATNTDLVSTGASIQAAVNPFNYEVNTVKKKQYNHCTNITSHPSQKHDITAHDDHKRA